VAQGSCTSSLRVIPAVQKPGTMPLLLPVCRGLCHGIPSRFLPARAGRPGVVVPDALWAVAIGACCSSPNATQAAAAPVQALPKSPSPFRVSPVNPVALLVSRRSRRQSCSPLLRHPRRLLRHEAAAVTSTPRSISVPLLTVAMVAGSGWVISRPTVIPVAAPGDSSIAANVAGIFLRRMARRSMANASRPICWCGPWAR
jgi:hypothetical protein